MKKNLHKLCQEILLNCTGKERAEWIGTFDIDNYIEKNYPDLDDYNTKYELYEVMENYVDRVDKYRSLFDEDLDEYAEYTDLDFEREINNY